MNDNFSIDIKMNPNNQIIQEHGLQSDGKVETFLRDEIERYSDPYVPFKKGTLKNNKSHSNNHSIRYNSPYARYHYYGKVMEGRPPKKVTNIDLKYGGSPKSGAKWDVRMWNDKNKEICKDINNYIKKGG